MKKDISILIVAILCAAPTTTNASECDQKAESALSFLVYGLCRKEERKREAIEAARENEKHDAWRKEQEVHDLKLEIERLKLQKEYEQLATPTPKATPPPVTAAQPTNLKQRLSELAMSLYPNLGAVIQGEVFQFKVMMIDYTDSELVTYVEIQKTSEDIYKSWTLESLRNSSIDRASSKACFDPYLWSLLDSGATFITEYSSLNNKNLFQTSITITDCK